MPPYGWDRQRAAKPGDALIELRCQCGGVWVLPNYAAKWACPDCHRRGIKTGRIMKLHGQVKGRPLHSGISPVIIGLDRQKGTES